MKRFALALLFWLAGAPCWAAINVCTETADAIANGPYESGDDITAAIQECWDNTTDPTYADPYIPAGNWSISSTLVGPFRSGYSLRGEGGPQTELLQDSSQYRGHRTSLIWVGDDSENMMEIRGAFVNISDMSFRASANSSATDIATNGIVFTKGGNSGFANGWSTVNRCSFWDFRTHAVQFGATEGGGETNCENITLSDCAIADCGVAGVKFSGAQQMGMHIRRCRFFGTLPAAILATGGGKTIIDQPQVLYGNVGTLFKATYVNGGFGQNNGDFYFRGVVIDNQVGENDAFKLFDVQCGNVKLVFDCGRQSCRDPLAFYDYEGTFGVLTNNSSASFSNFEATFNDMRGVTAANSGGDGGTPVFRFRDCVGFSGSPAENITGTYRVYQSGCSTDTGSQFYADVPNRAISSQVINTTGGAVGVVTSGSGEQTYGQQQPIIIDMQAVLTKYAKTIDDVTQADVTLKFKRGIPDNLADYDKNSVDDSEVTFAMEDVTVEDGSTESHLIVRATVPYASFGGANLRADRTYYIGCSLSFTGLTGSFEPDTMTGGTVKYTTQRVD